MLGSQDIGHGLLGFLADRLHQLLALLARFIAFEFAQGFKVVSMLVPNALARVLDLLDLLVGQFQFLLHAFILEKRAGPAKSSAKPSAAFAALRQRRPGQKQGQP